MSAHPPREERGEDKHFWKNSNDGYFSVKYAYNFLSAGNHQQADDVWRKLWRWQVPEKIKSFMWLFTHGKLHTAELRRNRGISDTASCSFGCQEEENQMHVIRDCSNAIDRWRSVVSPDKWDTFSTLQGSEWVTWNLTHQAGQQYTKKIDWAVLFGYICWDIWTSRCSHLFDTNSNLQHPNAYDSYFRACMDKDLESKFSSRAHNLPTISDRNPTTERDLVLAVDGSVLKNGNSGCRGILQDKEGRWICGFSGKLIRVPPVIAEILGILNGLHLCWNRGYRHVTVYSDCIEAINCILRGCVWDHPFIDIIDETRRWFHREWTVVINYRTREDNCVADRLAKMSHSLSKNFCIFDQPPPFLEEVESDDG